MSDIVILPMGTARHVPASVIQRVMRARTLSVSISCQSRW